MYYHVELDEHAVLLADGLPAESYLETGGRANFDNDSTLRELYPNFVARRWACEGCAPLIVTGPVLHAVRDRLNSRIILALAYNAFAHGKNPKRRSIAAPGSCPPSHGQASCQAGLAEKAKA